jgi:hypothetical protein
MARIGGLVTDPNVGAYCHIKLDDGKILLNDDRGSLDRGTVTITEVKWQWLGLVSRETIFSCDLESPEGQAVRTFLTRGAAPGSAAATPLGAFIEVLKECRTINDVRARCAALSRQARSAAAGGAR